MRRHTSWLENISKQFQLVKRGLHWWHENALVVCPSGTLREELLNGFHKAPYSGHLGITKTKKAIERWFWWPELRKDVINYVKSCDSCQRNKSHNLKPAGLMQPLDIPAGNWESVSMDFITGLPKTKDGKDAILVFVDRLSKMVHFVSTTTTVSAEETARLFVNTIFKLHGLPKDIVSDRDTRFTSKFWSEVWRLLGTNQSLSTAFHPQSDGQTERVNRVLEDYLRHYVNPAQNNWDEFLGIGEFAVNNAWQESIRTTPFFLNSGRHPVTPETKGELVCQVPQAKHFVSELQNSWQEAKEWLRRAQERQKAFADKKRREVHYQEGQLLLLSTKNLRIRHPGARKLLPKWIGPFRVNKKIGRVAYRLELPIHMRIHNVFHVALLKPYRSDGVVQPPSIPEILDDDIQFEIERVLTHRKRQIGKRVIIDYLIQWAGYGPEHNSWEHENRLHAELVKNYWDGLNRQNSKISV
jgi:transposase InsO family protein